MPEAFNSAIPPAINQNRYRTVLTPQEEYEFAKWVHDNKIPFDNSPIADYDMRGFWKAMVAGKAQRAPNLHFPDTWKTPFHRSLSNESIYAPPHSPHWVGNKLVNEAGQVVFDEDKRR